MGKKPEQIGEFEFGRPDGNADFLGKRRQVNAFIKHLETSVHLELNDGTDITYEAGTKYLDLHILGEEVDHVFEGGMTETYEFLVRSAEDMQELCREIKRRNKLKGTVFLAGVTNPRMAGFATDSMGFKVVTNDYQDWLTNKVIGPKVTVYTTLLELEERTKKNIGRLKRIRRNIYNTLGKKRS